MAPTPRRLVRSAVGLAAVAPAVGLIVLAIVLLVSGGFGGILAGIVVAGLAVALLAVALMMTHAPVSIAKLLRRTDEAREERLSEPGGPNGAQGSPEPEDDEQRPEP